MRLGIRAVANANRGRMGVGIRARIRGNARMSDDERSFFRTIANACGFDWWLDPADDMYEVYVSPVGLALIVLMIVGLAMGLLRA